MKTKKFWLAMAAAAILAGMVCTSCSSDDDPIVPPVPEVVESEVLDSGCSSDVAEDSGTEGTSLSYKSWIYVRQKTRATSDAKISVTLFNRFNNLVQEAEVSDFDFGTPKTEISCRFADSRTEQNFVTVTDSVLVYGLTYANGFRLEYELMFETPEYNDGVTRQQMPYHKIESVEDNGMTLSGIDNQIIDGKEWFCKLLRHSITVTFNGHRYEVAASVVVRSEIPGEDVLLSSRKVDEGLELVSTDTDKNCGVYRSWVEVEQNWSESGQKTVKKEVLLKHSIEFPNNAPLKQLDHRFSNWNNFEVEQTIGDPEINEGNYSENVAVNNWIKGISIRVVKSDATGFQINSYITCIQEKAVYKDDKLSCDFPCLDFAVLNISFANVQDWYFVEGDTEDENSYWAKCMFNYEIGYGEKVKYVSSSPVFFTCFE